MEIRKNLVDPSKYGTKCPYTMNPEFITVHNTYNDASAENEIAYMIRNNNEVSFHIAVDDKEAVQGILLERNAWHCGDGGGNGNRKSIGVEICYSLNGGNRYYKAEDNAAIIVAQLMRQYNIPISKVRTHQSWSGKYCPHRMLDEGRWNSFIEKVQNAYNGGGHAAPSTQPSNNGVGVVTITADVLRVRTGPGTNYDIVKKVYRGERYQSWGIQNGWYNVGGDQWVSGEYVRFER
ncbi:N-acetylmuramoyl-L-alanine amidase [Bacillus thuringiensis]|uniref:N-acetylmuramoyl-L-alanine amidase n=1 Tax=Bacillus thuringiensis TaxID=1428 RepID=UPI002E170BE5|nr:N-acetylmuramoyl-L-alanine amidase [Bacillus thuringiensis]MEC5307513.1 N-acetylmuramoyl-L-alanine amidase [Bacillus thuringiensis]